MKKLFFILSLLLLSQPVSWSLDKEKSFSFGSNVFQFEEPKSYYSNEVDPIVWQKLYFIRDGQKIELFKGEDVTFDLIDPSNVSKGGAYFMMTYLRYGYASGDRQYCALINTVTGCVISSSTWSPVCDGWWSENDGEIWIYPDDSSNIPAFINWNLNDAIANGVSQDYKNSMLGDINAKLCRGEPIQNIIHGPFKTVLYPQGEIYFEKNDGRYGPVKFILSAEDEQGGKIDEVVDQYEHNGGDANIESVFFYPIDGEKNIFVIVSWINNHQGEGVHGKFYEVHSYYKNNDGALISNQKVESDLNLKGFDGYMDSGNMVFPYKTALDVKKYITENY